MSAISEYNTRNDEAAVVDECQYTSFYVGDLLLAIDISVVQEINRQVDITTVPNAPKHVRGVINLRGDVATVIDLRTILGLPEVEMTADTRNLIIHSQGESIGLWIDKISDILAIKTDDISPAPANISGVEGRFFKGVYTMENRIAVILDIDQVLGSTD